MRTVTLEGAGHASGRHTYSPELLLKKLRLPAHFATSGLRTRTRVDPGTCAMAGQTTSAARTNVAKKAIDAIFDGILGKVRSIAENRRTTDFMAVVGCKRDRRRGADQE